MLKVRLWKRVNFRQKLLLNEDVTKGVHRVLVQFSVDFVRGTIVNR